MKKTKKILIIASLLILVIYVFRKAIGTGLIVTLAMFLYIFSDNSEETLDLGNGYNYLKPYGIAFDLYAYGGNGIFKEGGMTGMGMPVILPEIKKIANDSQFIVANQLFDRKETYYLLKTFLNFDSLPYKNKALNGSCKGKNPFYDSLLYKFFQKKYDGNTTKMKPFIDSVIVNNPYFRQLKENQYNYWIINKKKDYIYGPLSKERYDALKDSLHIGLKLKKPSEL